MGRGREYLGRYRMIRMIRAGQTCQVWEAIGDDDGRRVALKVLQPEVRGDKDEINYLKHELEVGKPLVHERVIEIFDFGIDREVPFLVMEYNAGKNMKLMIRQGIDDLAYMTPKIIEQSAEGLKYLHEQGWIHRDIKPDNFLVTDDGEVKLIDFALAVRVRSGLSKLFGGKVKVQGTRSYMAPEQIRGKAPDLRSDIYSFGCLLYELLSGKTPYTGTNPEELLMKHLHAAVPAVIAANRNVSPEFSDLVLRMMAKEMDQRPSSMESFLLQFHATRVFRSMPKPKVQEGAKDETQS